jgi:hypothetical protein
MRKKQSIELWTHASFKQEALAERPRRRKSTHPDRGRLRKELLGDSVRERSVTTEECGCGA